MYIQYNIYIYIHTCNFILNSIITYKIFKNYFILDLFEKSIDKL